MSRCFLQFNIQVKSVLSLWKYKPNTYEAVQHVLFQTPILVVSNIIKYLKLFKILFIFYTHTKHDEIRYLYKQARLTIVKSPFLIRTTQLEARCKYDVCSGPVLIKTNVC